MVLEELMGLMDEEFMDSLLFDIRFQYALHTTSFKEQPVSDRTFSRFRRRCLTYETETGIDLIHDTVKELSGEMAALNFKKLFGYLNSVGQCALIPQISEQSRNKNRNVFDVRASLKVGLQMEQGKLPSH